MDLFILMQERAVPLLVLTFFLVLNLAFLIGVWKKRINFSKLFCCSPAHSLWFS